MLTSFKERGLYAVLPESSIFMLYTGQEDVENTTYTSFMQLPDKYKVLFEQDELDAFLNVKKLDFIEQLPVDVYAECVANIL